MARLGKRLLGAALTLLGTSLVVFLIAHAVPGDVVAAFAGPQADAETRENIRQRTAPGRPAAATVRPLPVGRASAATSANRTSRRSRSWTPS